MKSQEQMNGWQDPTANKQQQGSLPESTPQHVPLGENVGMGQKKVRTTPPQFS